MQGLGTRGPRKKAGTRIKVKEKSNGVLPEIVFTFPFHLFFRPSPLAPALPLALAVNVRDSLDFNFQPRIDQRTHFH